MVKGLRTVLRIFGRKGRGRDSKGNWKGMISVMELFCVLSFVKGDCN